MKNIQGILTINAFTRLPVTVPAHEEKILNVVYSNGFTTEGSYDNNVQVDALDEYGRLCQKYGAVVIERVFGPDPSMLSKLLSSTVTKKQPEKQNAQRA